MSEPDRCVDAQGTRRCPRIRRSARLEVASAQAGEALHRSSMKSVSMRPSTRSAKPLCCMRSTKGWRSPSTWIRRRRTASMGSTRARQNPLPDAVGCLDSIDGLELIEIVRVDQNSPIFNFPLDRSDVDNEWSVQLAGLCLDHYADVCGPPLSRSNCFRVGLQEPEGVFTPGAGREWRHAVRGSQRLSSVRKFAAART